MRESDFIRQNRKKWSEFEEILKVKQKDPDKISDLFIQITDDLSYSRTFYPNRSVRYYLNNKAQQLFYSIYKNKKIGLNSITKFWKSDLPQIVYESRKELTLSLVIFTLSLFIGIFSSIHDPNFAKVILGDQYVEMTIKNISEGDPMAVYKDKDQLDMFVRIAKNNLLVAFRTYVFGVFFSIGTVAILLYNGIMVGTFQFFFYERGLFWDSFLTIWLHGTLEISSVVIAGGAGLKLGSGLIFPGTHSRMQAFQLSAKKSLGLMMGIFPIFIFAAIIESFVTRHTDVDTIYKILLILASLAFLLIYFVAIPLHKAKKGFPPADNDRLSPDKPLLIQIDTINTNGDIFSQVFGLYKKHLQKILSAIIIASIFYSIGTSLLLSDLLPEDLDYKDWFFISKLFDYRNYNQYLLLFSLNTLGISLNISLVTYLCLKFLHKDLITLKNYFIRHFYKGLIVSLIIQSAFLITPMFTFILLILLIPFLLLWHTIMCKENLGIFFGFKRSISLLSGSFGRLTGLLMIIVLVSVVYFFLIASPLTYFYFETLNWNLNLEQEETRLFFLIFSSMVSFIGLHLILPLFTIAFILSYYTIRESKEAIKLKERISNFGRSRNGITNR